MERDQQINQVKEFLENCCSFCGRNTSEVGYLLRGYNSFVNKINSTLFLSLTEAHRPAICSHCATIAKEIFDKRQASADDEPPHEFSNIIQFPVDRIQS